MTDLTLTPAVRTGRTQVCKRPSRVRHPRRAISLCRWTMRPARLPLELPQYFYLWRRAISLYVDGEIPPIPCADCYTMQDEQPLSELLTLLYVGIASLGDGVALSCSLDEGAVYLTLASHSACNTNEAKTAKTSALALLCSRSVERLCEGASCKGLRACVSSSGTTACDTIKRYRSAVLQGRTLSTDRITCFVRNTLKGVNAACADSTAEAQ